MRFKGRIELEHGLKQINFVPMVNIVFILFIFLLLFTNFLMQPGLKVYLPKALTSESVRRENIEILITGDNAIFLDGKQATMEQMKSLFKQAAGRSLAVLIKADSRVSLGKAVQVWDAARSAGVTQINIATNQK